MRPSSTISTGNANGSFSGALSGSRLQHPQAIVLDRELDVLHLAIVPLESLLNAESCL
jgi:hypothetical protein